MGWARPSAETEPVLLTRGLNGQCGTAQDLPAERFAAVEIAAGLRARFVDRAKPRRAVEGDAGTVAVLIHAARAVVRDDEFFRHEITGAQLDHQVAATAAAGAGRKIDVRVDASHPDSAGVLWRPLVDVSFLRDSGVRSYRGVVPNERRVFTDVFTKAWELADKPFMTVILIFEDAGKGKTKYTALVRHWTVADREMHEKMGFHRGWGQCADQLTALVTKK